MRPFQLLLSLTVAAAANATGTTVRSAVADVAAGSGSTVRGESQSETTTIQRYVARTTV
jgi:hypothetical protein